MEHYGWAQHTGGADAATRESSACAAQGFLAGLEKEIRVQVGRDAPLLKFCRMPKLAKRGVNPVHSRQVFGDHCVVTS